MKALYTVLGQDPPKRNVNDQSNRKSGKDINIDYVPKDKKDGKSGFKGGDYVDYEEVK
jgi:hypothetical protein